MERIKAMKRAWKIGMMFGGVICMILSSCYDKIDDFDILSSTEYVIERGTDTTIYIQTKGYNRMNGVIIDTNEIFFRYPREKYPITNQKDSLAVTYFPIKPMYDGAPAKSVNIPFFYITALSDDQDDKRPVYKVEIKNKHASQAHKITLLLMSKMAGHRIYFNIK